MLDVLALDEARAVRQQHALERQAVDAALEGAALRNQAVALGGEVQAELLGK